MSLVGSLVGAGAQKAASVAAEQAALKRFKMGKTRDQQDCIDFLYSPDGGGCGSKRSRLNINEYEQMVAQHLYSLNLRDRAIEKIGLDEDEISEIPPIVLSGYVFDADNANDAVLYCVQNGRAVSSRFSVSWIFFSRSQMYIYTYRFDTISDDTRETTKDFFYQDITCFTTVRKEVENISYGVAGCLKKRETAEKDVYTVDTLSIVVPGTSFSCSMRNNPNLEQSLQAAKAMLRERKMALLNQL